MKINLNQRHAVLGGAALALILGTAFGSVLRPNCDAAEYRAGPRLEMGRTLAEQPSQSAVAALPYEQAASEPAPMAVSPADQPVSAAKLLRQASPAPLQFAANTSDEDMSGTSRFNDDAPVGAPAKADQGDDSGVDGPDAPATENPPG